METEEDNELCEECGEELKYVVLSTDADGNRPEYGYYCKKCGY